MVFAVDSAGIRCRYFYRCQPGQQATLLEQWAMNPDLQRLPVLKALRDENLLTDNAKHAFVMDGARAQPLGTATGPDGELKSPSD